MACLAEPVTIELCRRRGDSFADKFIIKDAAGVPINITGYSFLLTVDISPAPIDSANNLFQLVGTITDAVNGAVEFAPTPAQADQTPSTYFHDIQQTDAGSLIRTIAVGNYIITQDVTK